MKTIRLLYPDYVSGGLETYYLGAALMAAILPENRRQPLVKVSIAPPDGKEKPCDLARELGAFPAANRSSSSSQAL